MKLLQIVPLSKTYFDICKAVIFVDLKPIDIVPIGNCLLNVTNTDI